MIRQILTILWNERKINSWILIEYIFIFCILWFCCDYLSYVANCYIETTGFDIKNTYKVNLQIKQTGEAVDKNQLCLYFMDRLKQHPEIESASLSSGAMPYAGASGSMNTLVLPETFLVNMNVKHVTPDFFDVFKLELTSGRMARTEGAGTKTEVLISPGRTGEFGYFQDTPYPAQKVTAIGSEEEVVTGVVRKVKNTLFQPYEYNLFRFMHTDELTLGNDIIIRTKPGVDKKFAERFTEEMRDQLSIGPYKLVSLTSVKDIEAKIMKYSGITDQLKNIYSMMFFLIINIFLGVIGTFWYRTQNRQSEIGLRIAMGAARADVRKMICTETLLLLFLASIIAINICLHISHTNFLENMGLPLADWVQMNIGWERYLFNYIITFFLLTVISLAAVWYPAWKASSIQPADALRND